MDTHGHPSKLHMDQASGYFLNEILSFCNYEGIELIKTLVRDRRSNGIVESFIGSLKLTF